MPILRWGSALTRRIFEEAFYFTGRFELGFFSEIYHEARINHISISHPREILPKKIAHYPKSRIVLKIDPFKLNRSIAISK